MLTETVASKRPAMPFVAVAPVPCVRMTKSPLPFDTVTKSVVPSPMPKRTFESEMRTTFLALAPLPVVNCSKAKLPLSERPNRPRFRLVPSTRMNLPCGRSIVVLVPPTVNVSVTGASSVFTFRPSVPLSVTPGTFIATVPLSDPAMPFGFVALTGSEVFAGRMTK